MFFIKISWRYTFLTYIIFALLIFFLVLGINLRFLPMQSKHSSTEQPHTLLPWLKVLICSPYVASHLCLPSQPYKYMPQCPDAIPLFCNSLPWGQQDGSVSEAVYSTNLITHNLSSDLHIHTHTHQIHENKKIKIFLILHYVLLLKLI